MTGEKPSSTYMRPMFAARMVAMTLSLTLSSVISAHANPSPQNPNQQPDVFKSQGQPQAPLQGGVSVNQPLNASQIHISQLMDDLYHKMSIIANGERRDPAVEARIAADMDEFNALQGVSSLARQDTPCVDKYKQAYPHLLTAADLNAEYSRIQRTASPRTLYALNQRANQESKTGENLLTAAAQCAQQVALNQPRGDVFNTQTDGGPDYRPGQTPPSTNSQPPSWAYPQPTLPQPSCASYAPRGFGREIEMWNEWKYRVTAAVARNFSASSLGSRQGGSPYVSADFKISRDGTINIVEVSNVSGGNGPPDLIAAVEQAILKLNGDMSTLAFPDQRSPVVQLNIIRDPWGCFQPGGYYQLDEGVGHGGGSVSGSGSAGGAEASNCPPHVKASAHQEFISSGSRSS